MTLLEDAQHRHFSDINERSYSAVFNDLLLPKDGTHIAGYAIITAVGLNALTWVKDIRVIDPITIMKLRAGGIWVCGKTGITTNRRTSDRALAVIGGITRGKKRVSTFVDRVYDHLCENTKHEAVHLIFGTGMRVGRRETHEVEIEASIVSDIMQPLGVEVLNLPGRTSKNIRYERKKIDLDLQLILPDFVLSN